MKLLSYNNVPLINKSDFGNFIQSQIVFDLHILSYIDNEGRQIFVDSLAELHSNLDKTVKVESMERYNRPINDVCKRIHDDYDQADVVTCHAFMSSAGSRSFDMHIDAEDVIIHTVYGTKHMMIEGVGEVQINSGEYYHIPQGTAHKALNYEESLILSFGMEKFFCDR